MNPIFSGVIECGKLKLTAKDRFDEYLHTLSGPVEVLVRPKKSSRSNRQNRFFHGPVLKYICDFTGDDLETMKEILKGEFLKDHKIIQTAYGEVEVDYVRPTSSLSTKEFCDFTEKCRRWAAEKCGVNIPDPNEVDY